MSGLSWRTLWLGAIFLLAAQVALFHGLRHDDAYITFRYGQNLAAGAGLSFNPGERILGSTSPLHMLLAALGYAAVGREALPSLMSGLGCLGWTAQAVALFFLLQRALGRPGALAVAAAVGLGLAGAAQWVALETDLAAALGLWAMVCGVEKRWNAAAVLTALAALMRPDGLLLGLPLGVLCLLDLRGRAWRPALLGVALLAPWVAFATVRFGSPLPRSASVKFQQDSLSVYGPHLFEHLPGELVGHPAPDLIIDALYLLALIGAAILVKRQPRLWVVPAWLLAHAAAYLWLRPGFGYTWHLYPEVLLFAVLGLACAAALLRGPRPLQALGAAACLLICGLTVHRTDLFTRSWPRSQFFGARDRMYRGVASRLRQTAKPGDVFSFDEVGTVAYYSGLACNDEAGLVTARPREALLAALSGKAAQPRFLLRRGGQPANEELRSAASIYRVSDSGFAIELVDLGAR